MGEQSSGTYIIDPDYTVVSCDQTMMDLHPQLKVGEKCYTCLMGLDAPCSACPVANHVRGPQAYLDTLRNIYETVEAVEVELPDGRLGHALVASTIGESEAIATRLPRTRKELQQLLDHEYYDALTGGLSRKGFIREAERILSRDDGQRYAILMMDLCNFRALNDAFGMDGGDQILRFVYDTLTESRLQPAASAHIESDRFVFLVTSGQMEQESLDDLMNLEWISGERVVHLHLRCGIYPIEDPQTPVSSMIDWASLARDHACQEGNGSVAVFTETMRTSYIDYAAIISSFQDSIRNRDFKVYFQPIFRADDERICSAEALVRWEHPDRGFISPASFIPALEKASLISELDRYVLARVYELQKSLSSRSLKFVPISVNLSRNDFYNDHLMNDIITSAQDSRLPAGSVNYEVTETSVAVLQQNCAYLLEQIQQVGAKVLLDDFGNGYSSLSMIGDYPFDIIKIDKSFTGQIEFRPTVRAVITATIDMCHKIGLRTVAEGVETREQLDFLRRNHCDYIQGFYYSKPMSSEAFIAYLSSSQDKIETGSEPAGMPVERAVDFENLVDLVDHSGMFIQVCHPEDHTMVFANELTRVVSGHPDEPYEGKKCYNYMLGLDAPCGHCPMKQMGDADEKAIEVDDGEHVFSLIGRYTVWNGRKVFIEYGRDITDTKAAQNRYASHIRSILENIPDGVGVFHVDLTADKWLSSGGNAQNARDMQNVKDVDTLIRMIASFVPDEEGQEHFFRTFCRQAQMEAYTNDRHQIILETKSYFDDRSIRWARITAQLIDNPNNGHIESIIYGVDISKERTHIEELERERRQSQQEKDELKLKAERAWDLYEQADRDRRYDYLTGLHSRLDLYQALERARHGEFSPITAVMLIDIDGFKRINDTYGHLAGDRCLRTLGKTILDFGVEHNISFYRYGGEEVVGLVHFDATQLPGVVDELLAAIRTTPITLDDGTEITLTASIGYTARIADYQEMVDRADQAMYQAKCHGKNQAACID
jgi:diguanylate cyclase (GGDEF)-like protein